MDPSILLNPIIEKLVSTAATFIEKEVSLVLGVKKEADKLQSNLKSIQAVVIHAEKRQVEDSQVRDWLAKLKDAAYKAEDTLETFATDAALKNRNNQVWDKRYRLKAAHKIKEISERLTEISDEKEKFHLKNESDNGSWEKPSESPTYSFFDRRDVCGRERDEVKVRELLMSHEEDEMCIIPIIGMAGLGKTTLARLVFNDNLVKDHFQVMLWSTVSDSVKLDIKRILREMLATLLRLKNITDMSQSQLTSGLLPILSERRFLIVLDDVWTEDYMQWQPFLNLLKQGCKGSKVLVTSRSTRIAEILDTRSPYFLDYLPEDECWLLFEKIAFTHSNASKKMQLEDTGKQIVGKCKGLPLAVKAMASLLRGHEDVNTWKTISNNDIWKLEDQSLNMNRLNILPALEISYIHLPSYHKQCFAHCSIFPKGYLFDKEELVKIWIAQGFIPPGIQETEEETGKRFFNEILSRSFFQRLDIHYGGEGRPEEIDLVRYQMHDLIHDLAQYISNPHCFQVKDNKSCSTSQESRHVSLLCEDVEPHVLSIADYSENLRTLLFPSESLKNFDQAAEKIFRKLKYLRMLDLSNSTLLELPSSIEELKLLRYLDLSKTEIKFLPNSICNLYNLQTLKLLGCLWLFQLPNDLGNLVNLRYLELDEMFWFKCSSLPPRIGNLTNLHNWHAFQVGHKSGYGIEELKNMVYVTGSLHISKLENAVSAGEAKLDEKKSLDKLVLEWSKRHVNPQNISDEEKLLKELQPHSNLTELYILNYLGNSFPDWLIGGFLQTLHTLTLKGCSGCRILSLGQIPCLQKLNIKGMQKLEKWSDETCTSLCRLKISCCENLSELPEYFFNLQVMKIKGCRSLKSLPVTPSLEFLTLVDNLVLEDFNEYIFQSDELESMQVFSFLELLEMKVINCPKLQALPNVFAPQKLEIRGCEEFSSLTSHNQRLQHLVLDKCRDGTLVRAIPDTSSLNSLVISNISNLNTFPRWPNLPELKALYITHCNDLVSLSGEGSLKSLSSLEVLSIRGCSNLDKLPDEGLPTALVCIIIVSCSSLKSLGTNGTLKSLNSLEDLHIEDCPQLLSFPEDGLPTSLQHLVIQNCPSLTEQCRTEDREGPEWPKINHIPDLEIDFIRSPHLSKKKEPWYLSFCCKAGFDKSATRQPEQQPDDQSSTTRQKGFTYKGKLEQGESSTAAP